jgi:crossover junction endodeoxyribonuclease RuvC
VLKNDSQTVLGVDPGSIITGFGVIKSEARLSVLDFGCIRPPAKLELAERYLIIYNGIEHLIKKYQPSAIAVETQFVYKNVQSAIKLGMARGMVLLARSKIQSTYL